MKYLIVGLGNPGAEYAETRHNIGFKVLDALAEASNLVFTSSKLAKRAEYKFKGRTFVLIKPTTYMNLSGKSVNYWLQKEKVSVENLFVIVDDIALPFGTIRIKQKGSDGGHNGLAHIAQVLNSTNYNRLRFGVGSDFGKGRQVDYVLGNWSEPEVKYLPKRITKAIGAIKNFGTVGIARTMNFSNEKFDLQSQILKDTPSEEVKTPKE